MNQDRRWIFAAVLALLLVPVWAAAQVRGTVEREHGEYVERISRTLAVEPGRLLEVSSDRGSIEVDTWERNEVKIFIEKWADTTSESKARDRFEKFEIFIEESGGDVLIRGEELRRSRRNRGNVRYELVVPSRFNVELQTAGGHIEVGDLKGDVRGRSSGGHIQVGRVQDGSVEIETAGGHLEVAGVQGGDLKAVTAGGHVSVGEVSGSMRIQTAGGAIEIQRGGETTLATTAGGGIEVEEADGDLVLNTSGGSIRIGRAASDVEANTAGGSIRLRQCGGAATLETAGGSIKVGRVEGPLQAETSGGNIRVDAAGSGVEAETSGGDVEVEFSAITRDADLGTILTTHDGDITVYLPDNVAVTIDAEIRLGRGYGRGYRIYSDFPLTMRGEGTRRVIGTGDINGGGDVIELRVRNGDIRIQRLGNGR